jgi:hypothetical protein
MVRKAGTTHREPPADNAEGRARVRHPDAARMSRPYIRARDPAKDTADDHSEELHCSAGDAFVERPVPMLQASG